ncbi:hypothetical protein BKA61DRAFT_607257 [Leptodontidium sp. MPI-SDFR-AT-0119]|nr:hypothetical protein BKA61DRAFT_607257 [Leptodontidium sp. MPI-SDFR-AT-0119]
MSSTILIIGATGNTGKSAVRNLSRLLESSRTSYRILALTRSVDSPASQSLAKLPNVELKEKDWTTIDAAWLQNEHIFRAYIAPHNLPSQFAEESNLHLALLHAGVRYVVRISTNAEYLSPTNPVFYGRAHWAIENLLSQPEFKDLQWTSLQPNFFTISYLASVADWVKKYRETGEQQMLTMVPAADVPVAMVDPEDVGNVGAHLLALDDPSPYNHGRYIISGPEDVTGKDLVKLAEKTAGVKAEKVEFKVTSWIHELVKAGVYPEKLLPSILSGFEPLWAGRCSLAGTPTSKQVLDLARPERTIEVALKAMLEG